MKIAILGTKGVPGNHGVEVVVDSLIPHLSSLGHQITVYGYESYTKSTSNYNGAEIKAVRGISEKHLEMISHMSISSLDTLKNRYDIVHIHSTDPCLLSWLPKYKYGLVATSHGQAYLREKWGGFPRLMSKIAEYLFLRIPDIVTSVSYPLVEYYRRKSGRNILFIPNGVNKRGYPNRNLLKKWNIEDKQYLFCTAGRIEKTKGLHTLLNAYKNLQLDMPLIIAGGGKGTDKEYYDFLKKIKPDGVEFVGFLKGDELFTLYAFSRIFVFPSEYEAMSMALLEGLSFGVPTVYSRIPENEVVVKDYGYPFRVGDAEALSDQVKHVLNNYDEALALADKAKNMIDNEYDWRKIAYQYDEIYTNLSRSRK